MEEAVRAFPNLFIWLIGVLTTGGLALLIYLIKENISVLKKLNATVNGMLIKFAVHEQGDLTLRSDVEKIEGRVDRQSEDMEVLKLDVHGLKNKINKHDNS